MLITGIQDKGCAEHGTALKCWRGLNLSPCSNFESGFSLFTILSGGTATISCQKVESRERLLLLCRDQAWPFSFPMVTICPRWASPGFLFLVCCMSIKLQLSSVEIAQQCRLLFATMEKRNTCTLQASPPPQCHCRAALQLSSPLERREKKEHLIAGMHS